MNVAHVLTAIGFCPSNGEAKRKIAEGAVRLDDVTVDDPGLVVVGAQEPIKLSLGKKRHAMLVQLSLSESGKAVEVLADRAALQTIP